MSFQEYLTANEGIAFPFRSDSLGLAETGVHGATAELPRDFLLDAVLTTGTDKVVGTVFLSRIQHTSTGLYRIHFIDDRDATVAVVELSDLTPVNPVYATYDVTTIAMVPGPAFYSFLGAIPSATEDLFGYGLPLEDSAVELRPARLTSIILKQDSGDVTITGEVQLIEGYNITLGDDANEITIAAVGGSGVGQYPGDCEAPPPIDYVAKINGVGTDEFGAFTISCPNCHRTVQSPDVNTVVLYNDCKPCCKCEQYGNMNAAINRRYTEGWNKVYDKLKDLIDSYNEKVEEFNNTRAYNFRQVWISGTGIVLQNDEHERPLFTFSVVINNRKCQEIGNGGATLLALRVVLEPEPGSLTAKKTVYTIGTSTNKFDNGFNLFSLDPGKSVRVVAVYIPDDLTLEASLRVSVQWLDEYGFVGHIAARIYSE